MTLLSQICRICSKNAEKGKTRLLYVHDEWETLKQGPPSRISVILYWIISNINNHYCLKYGDQFVCVEICGYAGDIVKNFFVIFSSRDSNGLVKIRVGYSI